MSKKRLVEYLAVGLLVLVGGCVRFTKLNWGQGYFFHPDERNIATAVAQLKLPTQMDPHFYAYGTFPIYVYFFITKFVIGHRLTSDVFETSILVGRFISALVSTMSIVLVYKLVKGMFARNLGWRFVSFFAAVLVTFSPGLIQYAHFATVESLLAFLYLGFFLFFLKFQETQKNKWLWFSAITVGLTISTKITSVLLLPVLAIGTYLQKGGPRKFWSGVSVALILVAAVFVLTSPFFILNFEEARRGLKYESDVATGKLPVFYTVQYMQTVPVVWQLTQVLPWSLGFMATAILPMAWTWMGVRMIGHRKKATTSLVPSLLGLIWGWVTLFFFVHAFLYVKWIRYLAPILPFVYITIAVFANRMRQYKYGFARFVNGIVLSIILISTAYQGLKLANVYRLQDTRIAAARWAGENIPPEDKILSEVYDLGVIAMPPTINLNTKLINFYELDEGDGTSKLTELVGTLENTNWILVPSRRVYGNLTRFPKKYPMTARYYKALADGELGFERSAIFQVKTFLDGAAEETYEVFDHPKVMWFKKIRQLTQDDYIRILTRD